MYNKEEQQLAKSLVDNKPLMDFLGKYLLNPLEQLSHDIVLNKTNEEAGELIKVDMLAQQKILHRFSEIKRMAAVANGNPSPVAPK